MTKRNKKKIHNQSGHSKCIDDGNNWADDDEVRRDVYNKLANKHNPEKAEHGHWERWSIIQKSFTEAENYYDAMSEDV